VGEPRLDAQHREIIVRLRLLGEAIGAEQPEGVAAALADLSAVVREHFADEERYMAELGYAHRATHAEAHAACLKSLDAAVRYHADGGASERFLDVLERVARWLDVHLRSEDLRLSRHGESR
jgi:hemerythrin-like metal-binding protein